MRDAGEQPWIESPVVAHDDAGRPITELDLVVACDRFGGTPPRPDEFEGDDAAWRRRWLIAAVRVARRGKPLRHSPAAERRSE